MCWADKLGVLWAFVVYVFFLGLAEDKAGLFSLSVTGEILLLILPVWIFFRLVDWVLDGPNRRRA